MIVRRVREAGRSVFLTFDDGPDDTGTAAALDVLKSRGAHATFFLVADRIAGREKLLGRILDEGHTIGNHSLDHKYRNFFKARGPLAEWVTRAERKFAEVGLKDLVGFRPPAGIVTPPLMKALAEKQEPLILWSERFYDAVIPWSLRRALRSAKMLEPGEIVLLHDRGARLGETLDAYVLALQKRGLRCEALTRDMCLAGTSFS